MKVIIELDDIAMAATLIDAVRAQQEGATNTFNYLNAQWAERRDIQKEEEGLPKPWTKFDQDRLEHHEDLVVALSRLMKVIDG